MFMRMHALKRSCAIALMSLLMDIVLSNSMQSAFHDVMQSFCPRQLQISASHRAGGSYVREQFSALQFGMSRTVSHIYDWNLARAGV